MVGTCTIVTPTYNEEKNIANMARAIREAYPDYKILFMDDNSTDRSREEVEALNDPLVTFFVRKPEERGVWALPGSRVSPSPTRIMPCAWTATSSIRSPPSVR